MSLNKESFEVLAKIFFENQYQRREEESQKYVFFKQNTLEAVL
jgi:hypothetical protein